MMIDVEDDKERFNRNTGNDCRTVFYAQLNQSFVDRLRSTTHPTNESGKHRTNGDCFAFCIQELVAGQV